MKQNLENTKYVQTRPYSILVTGATGFIGSKLVEMLTQNGYSVRGMSRKKISDIPGIKYVKWNAETAQDITLEQIPKLIRARR